MAAKEISSLYVEVGARLDGLRKAVNKSKKYTKGISKNFSAITSTITKLTKTTALFTAGLATASAYGLKKLVSESMNTQDRLGKLSDRLQINVRDLQAYQLAAEEAGISSDTLSNALGTMNKRLGEAAMGRGTALQGLNQLGLTAQYLQDLSSSDAFDVIAQKLQEVDTIAARTSIADSIFGRQGREMVDLLPKLSTAFDSTSSFLKKWGISLDRNAIKKIEIANDAIGRLKMSLGGIGANLAAKIAPFVTELSKQLTIKLGEINLKVRDTSIKDFTSKLGDLFESLKSPLLTLIDIIQTLVSLSIITKIGSILGALAKTGGAGITVGMKAGGAIGAGAAAVSALTTAGLIGFIGKNLISPSKESENNMLKLLNRIDSTIKVVVDILSSIYEFFKNALKLLDVVITKIFSFITDAISKAIFGIATILEHIPYMPDSVVKQVESIAEFQRKTAEKYSKLMDKQFDEAIKGFKDLANNDKPKEPVYDKTEVDTVPVKLASYLLNKIPLSLNKLLFSNWTDKVEKTFDKVSDKFKNLGKSVDKNTDAQNKVPLPAPHGSSKAPMDYGYVGNFMVPGLEMGLSIANDHIKDFISTYEQHMQTLKNLTQRWADQFTDVLTEAFMTGKLNFTDLINSMIADMMRIQIQRTIQPWITDIMGSIASGVLGNPIDTAAKAKATGGSSGGVNSNIQVINNAGADINVRQSNSGDIRKQIIEVNKSAMKSGEFDDVFSTSFGFQRRGF